MAGGAAQPLISFVGYTRNDGYAYAFEKRLVVSAVSLADQAERFQLSLELVLVEWNPPSDQRSVASLFADFKGNPYFSLRVITVPSGFHRGFRGADEKGLHPARALNVGYRRARGQFFTPFASDAILDDKVLQFIKDEGLDTANIYRLNRADVPESLLDSLDPDDFNRAKLLEAIEGSERYLHAPLDHDMSFHYGVKPLHTNACGDFLLMSSAAWHRQRGQRENTDVACLDTDSIALHAAAANGLREVRLPADCMLYKISHGRTYRHRVKPHRKGYRRVLEQVVNGIVPHRPTRALIRALFDIPRRQVAGLTGHFPSMERNFILWARLWQWRSSDVRLNGPSWGLKGETLKETEF